MLKKHIERSSTSLVIRKTQNKITRYHYALTWLNLKLKMNDFSCLPFTESEYRSKGRFEEQMIKVVEHVISLRYQEHIHIEIYSCRQRRNLS